MSLYTQYRKGFRPYVQTIWEKCKLNWRNIESGAYVSQDDRNKFYVGYREKVIVFCMELVVAWRRKGRNLSLSAAARIGQP